MEMLLANLSSPPNKQSSRAGTALLLGLPGNKSIFGIKFLSKCMRTRFYVGRIHGSGVSIPTYLLTQCEQQK